MTEDEIIKFEQESPIRMVSKLNRLTLNSLSEPLASVGIARGTLPFLMEVYCREGIIQEDITRILTIDRAATARALRQLEENSLVEREEDSEDRRCKRVYPTDKALEMRDDIMDILKKQREIMFAGFDEKERGQFMDMLDRMVKNTFRAVGS
ncbi:MarR family transcriptional regulator [Maridesulfovibrio sp.]|uniref:MarR family winged helix-turn-helix transcriptional regulator n=1 Tax=Maridesulfovibrio sp. TaxID=2795000 RepID=UPI002A18B6BD|nr:MarR family transcriptional regulator [Maridesulfovibrio sp.]